MSTIVGTGIDVVSISRFEALMDRQPGVVERLFTARESMTPEGGTRSSASLAARFAAKEAVAKALGAPSGLHWHDCEILTDTSGRPVVNVRGSVAEAARGAGVTRWHLSLSHDADMAIAQVIAEAGA